MLTHGLSSSRGQPQRQGGDMQAVDQGQYPQWRPPSQQPDRAPIAAHHGQAAGGEQGGKLEFVQTEILHVDKGGIGQVTHENAGAAGAEQDQAQGNTAAVAALPQHGQITGAKGAPAQLSRLAAMGGPGFRYSEKIDKQKKSRIEQGDMQGTVRLPAANKAENSNSFKPKYCM